TSSAAIHAVRDQVGPDELEDPRIVVAVRQIVVQGREAVLLASLLHRRKLAAIELVLIDVSPVITGTVHGEAGSDGTIGRDDDMVLGGATLPFREMQLAVLVLDDAGSMHQTIGKVPVQAGAVAIPTEALEVGTAGHADERLDFLQALDGVHHLVAGFVLLD